jgi:AcrR family transcriptional regulator
MVQAEALKLFAAKGYEQTTIDDIAHAAAMSPRTFFRYFPTKEAVVLWDEYDERPFHELWSGSGGGDPLIQLISTVRTIMADVYVKDPELLLNRIKLSFAVPEIRARFLDQQLTLFGPYVDELAAALGTEPDDLRLRVMLVALYSAIMVAVERWQHNDGRDDLIQLLDKTLIALAAGMPDLRAVVPVADPADNPAGEATDRAPRQ